MSFLGDLVSSIGGEKAPAPPAASVKPPSRPASTNPVQQPVIRNAPTAASAGTPAKPAYKGTAGMGHAQSSGGLKRKAEEMSSERPVKLPKPSLSTHSDSDGQKSNLPTSSDTKSPITSKVSNGTSLSQPNSTTAKLPAKAPAKGSYAALLARAKEAQQTKTPSGVGMIKHQATEKIKPSKLAERKREDQEKNKPAAPNSLSKPGSSKKSEPRRRSVSPVKKNEPPGPKQPKAPRPPLHGPGPVYKGTLGQAPRKPKEEVQKKRSNRYDEYLGTDEEDEGDFEEDDEDQEGYYSDDMSDMEGGFEEMEAEDRAAERFAREDDARELALEQKLKREKLERKQKLAALAKKQR